MITVKQTNENLSTELGRHYKSLSEMHSWTAIKCLKDLHFCLFMKSFRVKMSVNGVFFFFSVSACKFKAVNIF